MYVPQMQFLDCLSMLKSFLVKHFRCGLLCDNKTEDFLQLTLWKPEISTAKSWDLSIATDLHREIMPLRIAVACATWCHSCICQSGERRMSGRLYTVAFGYQIKPRQHYISHCQLHLHEVTIKWQMTLWKALWQTRLDVIAWFRPELPVYKCLLILLSPLW